MSYALSSLLLILTAMTWLNGAESHEVTAIPALDLTRYQGVWYELARLPNRFERGLDHVTATYTINDNGTVKVVNAGRKADGTASSVTGKAWRPDADKPAQLRVRFFWPFYGAYWVIGLDPQYRWAVVGHPSRDYLWFLSRTPTVDAATWKQMETIATDQGYGLGTLERIKQTPAP